MLVINLGKIAVEFRFLYGEDKTCPFYKMEHWWYLGHPLLMVPFTLLK
jgi:hypothetical protein